MHQSSSVFGTVDQCGCGVTGTGNIARMTRSGHVVSLYLEKLVASRAAVHTLRRHNRTQQSAELYQSPPIFLFHNFQDPQCTDLLSFPGFLINVSINGKSRSFQVVIYLGLRLSWFVIASCDDAMANLRWPPGSAAAGESRGRGVVDDPSVDRPAIVAPAASGRALEGRRMWELSKPGAAMRNIGLDEPRSRPGSGSHRGVDPRMPVDIEPSNRAQCARSMIFVLNRPPVPPEGLMVPMRERCQKCHGWHIRRAMRLPSQCFR